MKKNSYIFNSFLISIVFLLGLNILFHLYPSIIVDVNLKINIALKYENIRLKNEYKKLNERIVAIEDDLNSLNDYDTYINSKILGLDVDSIGITLINDIDIYDLISKNNYQTKLDQLSETINNQRKKTIKLAELSKANENILNSYPNAHPLDTVVVGSKFGIRLHPVHKKLLFHKGVDIKADIGSNVYATMDGTISRVKFSKYGYGNHIRLTNSFGFETRYAHLSVIFVNENDVIKKGNLIGKSGNSGISTTPHLHYEIRKFNKIQNPSDYIFMYKFNNNLLVRNEKNKN